MLRGNLRHDPDKVAALTLRVVRTCSGAAAMETRLQFDNRNRTLGLCAKEHFVSDDNVVLTVQGKLDTSTGELEGKIALKKKFFPEASNRWYSRADVGASYETATDEILYGVDAKRCFELSPDGLLTLDTKAGLQMSANRKRVWKGKVELSQKVFNFTEDQDLKIKLGYDIAMRRPYGQLRENNWSLDTDFSSNWSLRYDL